MFKNGSLTGQQGLSVRLDWITSLLIVTAAMIFLFGTVFVGTQTSLLANGAITIMIAGLTLGIVFKTYIFDLSLDKRELSQIMVWTLVCMGAVLMVNRATPSFSEIELSGFNPRLFGVLIAVSETVFFQGFLLPWLQRLTKMSLLAVILCAAAFAAFHLNIYGGDIHALLVVLGGGLVLNYATLQTKRLTPACLSHSLINSLASGG